MRSSELDPKGLHLHGDTVCASSTEASDTTATGLEQSFIPKRSPEQKCHKSLLFWAVFVVFTGCVFSLDSSRGFSVIAFHFVLMIQCVSESFRTLTRNIRFIIMSKILSLISWEIKEHFSQAYPAMKK